MKYKVYVRRCEEYTGVTTVEADSEQAAKEKIATILTTQGWDGVFPDSDGEYDECYSNVEDVKPDP